MSQQKRHIQITVIVLLGLVALVVGFFFANHFVFNVAKQKDFSRFGGTLLVNPRQMADFSITDTLDKPFNNYVLEGHWTLMFFGFTNCGYLCPTTMAELAKFYRLIEAKPNLAKPDVVMVSIDPNRDSSEKLHQYVTAFHPTFRGAIGSDSVVRKMARELGIAYFKVGKVSDKQYDVDHNGAVVLFNPKGEIQAFFSSPQDAKQLALDYELLVS